MERNLYVNHTRNFVVNLGADVVKYQHYFYPYYRLCINNMLGAGPLHTFYDPEAEARSV